MKFITQLILVVIFYSSSTFAENNPELESLKSLADMIGVDVKSLQFQDDAKNEITAKEFNLLVGNNRSFDIVKISGEITLVINPMKSNEPTPKNEQEENVAVSTKSFPDFNLASTSGKKLTLKNFQGKPTFLSFYYSTCIPCIQEVPVLNKLKRALSKQVNFIAVTYEDLDVVLDFSKKYNFEWDSMIEAEKLVNKIGIPAYPAFVLLNKNGTPINVLIGNVNHNTVDALTKWIKESGVSI
ncbi:hypothetical protein NBRC116600_15190 [Thalassotalea sp. SU-HH00458]